MERQSIYGWEHSMLLRYQLFSSWYIDLTQSQTKFQQDFSGNSQTDSKIYIEIQRT